MFESQERSGGNLWREIWRPRGHRDHHAHPWRRHLRLDPRELREVEACGGGPHPARRLQSGGLRRLRETERRGSTEPRRVVHETRKRLVKKFLLLLRGLLLGCGLLRGLLLGCHVLPPSLRDMDPRFHWIGDHCSLAETRPTFFSCTYLLCN